MVKMSPKRSTTRSTGTQGEMMLAFSDPHDFNQLKLGLCLPPKPLHEYACTLRLKLPQFCYLGRYCFGRDPWESPYLLQVINSSFSRSLAWLCLLARHPPRGELSFWVTGRVKIGWHLGAGQDAAVQGMSDRQLGRAQSLTHPNAQWMRPSMRVPVPCRLGTDFFDPGWGTDGRSRGCWEGDPGMEGRGMGVNAYMC